MLLQISKIKKYKECELVGISNWLEFIGATMRVLTVRSSLFERHVYQQAPCLPIQCCCSFWCLQQKFSSRSPFLQENRQRRSKRRLRLSCCLKWFLWEFHRIPSAFWTTRSHQLVVVPRSSLKHLATARKLILNYFNRRVTINPEQAMRTHSGVGLMIAR